MHFRNAGGVDIDFGENKPPHFLLRCPLHGVVVSGRSPQPRIFRSGAELARGLRAHPQAQVVRIPSHVPDGAMNDAWADIIAPARRTVAGMHEADCESFARAAALLTEALAADGFALLGYIEALGGKPTGHASAVIGAPDGSVWLSTNDELRQAPDRDSDGRTTHAEIMQAAAEIVGDVYNLGHPARPSDGIHLVPGTGCNSVDAMRQAREIGLLNDPTLRATYELPRTPEPTFYSSSCSSMFNGLSAWTGSKSSGCSNCACTSRPTSCAANKAS
jgi:hypothetical protein